MALPPLNLKSALGIWSAARGAWKTRIAPGRGERAGAAIDDSGYLSAGTNEAHIAIGDELETARDQVARAHWNQSEAKWQLDAATYALQALVGDIQAMLAEELDERGSGDEVRTLAHHAGERIATSLARQREQAG